MALTVAGFYVQICLVCVMWLSLIVLGSPSDLLLSKAKRITEVSRLHGRDQIWQDTRWIKMNPTDLSGSLLARWKKKLKAAVAHLCSCFIIPLFQLQVSSQVLDVLLRWMWVLDSLSMRVSRDDILLNPKSCYHLKVLIQRQAGGSRKDRCHQSTPPCPGERHRT